MNKFWLRLTQWEYWPFSVLYFPVFFYYIWLALKNRSFFFFTAANPQIHFGGMFGEKKSDIFHMLPAEYLPITTLMDKGEIKQALLAAKRIGYPLIAKPNIGERGAWVQKIRHEKDLIKYVDECPVDFLLQEMVTHPVELGVFYIRYPDQQKGKVTSIVRKNFLSVIGDGQATIMELLHKNPRALLTANLENDLLKEIGAQIPHKGEEILIEPIGNHCRGTQFINDNSEIDEELQSAIDTLAGKIADFYFGRFDLRCRSYDDLKQLKNLKILELNGAGAEPGHIYHPGYPLRRAYRDIFWHLKVLADISKQNKKRGANYWSFKQGLRKWKEHRNYNRLLSA